MDNTEKKGRSGGTVGVGYISIMLIFTVICLTIFAVLSFQAVYSSDKMTNRSDGFTQQYYTADTEAKKTLSRLDGLAAEALDGFSFEEGFIEAVSGVEGVSAARTAGGVRVEYSQAINERQTLGSALCFSARLPESGSELKSGTVRRRRSPVKVTRRYGTAGIWYR